MNIKSFLIRTPFFKVWHSFRNIQRARVSRIKAQKLLNEGEELMKHFSKALNKENIKFWLDYGTLLGFYREGGIIPFDNDMDVGAFIEDADRIKKTLEEAGFTLVRWYWVLNECGIEQCYAYKNTTIDVFYYQKDCKKNTFFCNSFQPNEDVVLNKELKFRVERVDIPACEFVRTTYLGSEVYIPSDPVAQLTAHYGKDFMIPNPHFNYRTDSLNLTEYSFEEKQGRGVILLKY